MAKLGLGVMNKMELLMSKELLQQALDALESMKQEFRGYDLPYGSKAYAQANEAAHVLRAALATPAVPLTDEQIEQLRENTFSVNNPFCPVDSKSMRKAVRAAERAHGITGVVK